ncbi:MULTISPECIES: UDP-glucose dehydrogenase family protein [Gammaproteobacteria]|jgi:UDPglucose 6-dehydrogenase|uniref:UDP-glucose 6-dehydrogenase n=1 Tax=Vreelandella halophila TaxID=86177 RepID=A0A9X4YAN6_9GAMM|nr:MULTISPECIES: UDP-glucose/GDP-mannose dehydrogenase family protein [Gammaproteobacteria]KAA8985354.1 UDP-glucose/GDP-mannose dehydrogenase family protein [Halospina sp. K52047b]MYL25773.1 nucleotide sugar dehydrogenase [Halomonas utahensis]MYL75719.1 nucleotide sugar dehydrogenase [Halomonas sp. 22501_18_FS]
MRITIFGTGYVGLVTGACLAEVGHHVMCMDVDQAKIDRLREGIIPIYEPGLEPIVAHNTAAGRLQFTTDVVEAVDYGELQFIAVGTPSDEDGSADLKYVLAVAGSIGEHMNDYKVVIDKSTVPVGTADKVREAVRGKLLERSADIDFDVVSNPEFLKEGAAVDDFMKPDRIIVGTDSDRPQELLRELYYPFNRNHERVIFMDVRSAELTKYAANAMLATKISFMNEVANLAERLGADIEHVRRGMGSDPRIGYHFIYPGCGYGGSCFPKDVKALAWTAREYDYEARLLDAVEAVNSAQKHVLFDKVSHYYGGDLAGKTVALWGLSFKPKTDDMREAPSRVLMEKLWAAGASVQAFDPEAMEETQRIYPDQPGLQLCGTKEQALKGADCLVICTEWKEFRSPDFAQIAAAIRSPVVFDGRNLYDEKMLGRHGLSYYAIGRGLNQFGTR